MLCGYKTWSPTLKEENRLRVFQSRVMGKRFKSKTDEVMRGWRKLQNEKLLDSYS
jgi:hypothetical protein